eukprot:42700-Alexandrium_andersonii.AAC.1
MSGRSCSYKQHRGRAGDPGGPCGGLQGPSLGPHQLSAWSPGAWSRTGRWWLHSEPMPMP